MIQSGIFSLDWGSIADAVLTAVITAVVVAFVGVVQSSGFDVFTANWGLIGHNMVNIAFLAAVISLGQDFVSTNSGSVLGLTPPYTHTPVNGVRQG